MSITRIFVMDQKNLQPDPTDYQIMRCSNCLQIAACLCSIAAAISGNDACQDASQCLNCLAECVVRTVMGCMGAQMGAEISHTLTQRGGLPTEAPEAASVPKAQVISRE